MLLKKLMTGDIGFGPMVARKGGGGGGSTSVSGVDPTFKPYFERGLQRAEEAYDKGQFSRVAKLSPTQQAGLAAQEALAADALRGEGVYNLEQAIANDLARTDAAYRGQQSSSGTLGSARANRAREAGLADRALQLRQADIAAREAGGQRLFEAGSARQQQLQNEIDATYQGLERLFGLGSSAPVTRSESTSGGGGK